ncbi:MAG: zeta toxin family protein [Rhodanobacter sp.]
MRALFPQSTRKVLIEWGDLWGNLRVYLALGRNMNGDRILVTDIGGEVDRLFDDSSLAHDGKPRAVILMGGVAAGKTTLRQSKYSHGFVLIDAAEMFHHLSGDAFLEFPDALREQLELIGPLAAQRAVSERRHIVTEIIGAEPEPAEQLLKALKSAGYYVEMVGVTCDLDESIRRNQERGDNISAYYAEPFQRRWLIDACAQASPKQPNSTSLHQSHASTRGGEQPRPKGMFSIFKRKGQKQGAAAGHSMPPLYFKDGNAALEYACEYMDCDLREGALLPAVVMDARSMFGTTTAVKRQDDGNQLATLRIPSRDGGFLAVATTANPKGPVLQVGQLVAWQAMQYSPAFAKSAKDKRFGWVGLILGTLKPEYANGSWAGDARFAP